MLTKQDELPCPCRQPSLWVDTVHEMLEAMLSYPLHLLIAPYYQHQGKPTTELEHPRASAPFYKVPLKAATS